VVLPPVLVAVVRVGAQAPLVFREQQTLAVAEVVAAAIMAIIP
jgi:hypothetical protein